ncbi:MAG: O-antigen ligase family protein [Bacteroidota bacterium]
MGLLSLIWIFEKLGNKRKALDRFGILILLFGFVRLLSIIFSKYPEVSVHSLYKEALFYFGFFSINYYLKVLDKQRLIYIVYGFIISAFVVAGIGVILFNLGSVERAQSVTSGYSAFSSYLLTGIGLSLCVHYRSGRKYIALAWLTGVSLIFAGIITSLGRTNIAIAIALFGLALLFRKIEIKPAILIATITLVLSSVSFYNNRGGVTERIENPVGLSDRDIILKGAKALILEQPLIGFGPRTFQKIFPYSDQLSDKGVGSWHNDFLDVYFESGILGLIAFLLIIYTVLREAIRYLRQKQNQETFYRDIVMGVFLAVIGLVLSAMTAGFINSPTLSIVFAFLISLLSAVIFRQRQQLNQLLTAHPGITANA